MHDARLLYMYLVSPRTIYKFAQVSSLKSQVSSLKSLWTAQVSSLKSQVFVSFFCFFSFHDMYSCAYSTVQCARIGPMPFYCKTSNTVSTLVRMDAPAGS